ncbi:MAG TPA: 2-C-methyl-D-erythritol 4-phosphate cytidylyltransferase, partial [Lachnospiraceae bacterium]|nr:2-C-methyl-D-erythritol 4-phosphate cytidylyltransferase [Lachnospiraceae bacterium]
MKESKRASCVAVVLAGGRGKRMGTTVAKQYLLIEDKPVLYYSLKAFEDSDLFSQVIL